MRFELTYQAFAEPDLTCQTQCHYVVEPVGNDPTPQDFQSRAITLSAIVPYLYPRRDSNSDSSIRSAMSYSIERQGQIIVVLERFELPSLGS